jgi:hypothetical protein
VVVSKARFLERFPTKILDFEVSNRNSYGFGEFYYPRKTKSEPKQLEKPRGAAASHVLRSKDPRDFEPDPQPHHFPTAPSLWAPRHHPARPSIDALPGHQRRPVTATAQAATLRHRPDSYALPLATLPACATACHLAPPSLRNAGERPSRSARLVLMVGSSRSRGPRNGALARRVELRRDEGYRFTKSPAKGHDANDLDHPDVARNLYRPRNQRLSTGRVLILF